jgi:hypothetical protein
MPGTQNLQRIVLLPKRLADRVALIEPGNHDAAASPRPNTWGLAERVAALPGIRPEHTILADSTLATDHFIEDSCVLQHSWRKPQLLCHIDCQGILLAEISPVDKEEVLQKGWSSSAGEALILFLPRDSIEMEIVWRIVLLAYHFLTSRPATVRTKTKSRPIMPSVSSMAKYWA